MEQVKPQEDWRDIVLSDPDMILEDRDLMDALIAANERQQGNNIVDMRGMAMDRLQTRLGRLEDTHRSVIAAAYENLAGMNQIHRAVLKLMDQPNFEAFMMAFSQDIPTILRVDTMRLVLESAEAEKGAEAPQKLKSVLSFLPRGAIGEYLRNGRDVPLRPVTLRQIAPRSNAAAFFGAKAPEMHSEALVKLDLGEGRMPAMIAMGAEDPHHFRANQGTDLLVFFGQVVERLVRKHLG